jgi:hypothetical protein
MTLRRSPDGDAPASTAGTACLERPRPTWITPARLFQAADAPDPGYPEVLPFVPGYPVSITGTEPGLKHGPSAQWWGVPDPEAVFARLVRASQEAGWACASAEGRAAIQADVVSLHREGRVRTIVATRVGPVGMVTLSDRAGE